MCDTFINSKGFLVKTKKEDIMNTNKKAKMWVKRIVVLVIAGGLMFLMMNCAGTERLRKGEESSVLGDCTPAGTWYGGSYNPDHAGFKYQYTFIPVNADHFILICDGAYNPDSLGAAVLTNFTGELVKKSDKNYEIRIIALSTNDPTHPPEELPVIIAGRADVELDSCDQMTITYTFGAFYEWGKVPFVDDPLLINITEDKPVMETLNRMPMRTQLPKPPPSQ